MKFTDLQKQKVEKAIRSILSSSDLEKAIDRDFNPIEIEEYGICIHTSDRGHRLDHCGPEGESWAEQEEAKELAAPYHKKWNPIVKKIKSALKNGGFRNYEVNGAMQYGEKGHIYLDFSIEPKEKKEVAPKTEPVVEETVATPVAKETETKKQSAPKAGSKSEEMLKRLKDGQSISQVVKEMGVYWSQVDRVVKCYM